MGQQQLLLIILGTIIVGVAISVGVTMFVDNATSSNRDAVTMDLLNLASKAQAYYRKPEMMGGGGYSFEGLTTDAAGMSKLTSKPTNTNGAYAVMTAGTATSVVLKGVGVERGTNGSAIEVRISVFSDSLFVNQVN